MELDTLWTGKIGDVADGYFIDSFLPDIELGRVIRLRQQVTGEFFLLTDSSKRMRINELIDLIERNRLDT